MLTPPFKWRSNPVHKVDNSVHVHAPFTDKKKKKRPGFLGGGKSTRRGVANQQKNSMEVNQLDYVLVPAGLLVLLAYHGWLLYSIIYNPKRTVIGLNSESRHRWVHSLMADPLKNGVLAIQTLRNNMMASTQLATIAITLSSLITALVSSESSSSSSENPSLRTLHLLGVRVTYSFTQMTSKYFAVLLCFLLAFFCNMQAIRYYAHVSFLITSASSQGNAESIEFVARHLNQGSLFWSLGMRAFYLSFPLLLWIFGCIPMFICCIVLTFVLYFLDTTSHFTKDLQNCPLKKENASRCDTESATNPWCNGSGSSDVTFPLLVGMNGR